MTSKKGIQTDSKNDARVTSSGIRAKLSENKSGGPGTWSNTRPGTGKMKATK
ncbi:hypothetical protein HZA99_01250 [Candidatus Woesearchaeota archaeon]|nr:hypothetical protein [Candidatus Woesearchaeota archaeon]